MNVDRYMQLLHIERALQLQAAKPFGRTSLTGEGVIHRRLNPALGRVCLHCQIV